MNKIRGAIFGALIVGVCLRMPFVSILLLMTILYLNNIGNKNKRKIGYSEVIFLIYSACLYIGLQFATDETYKSYIGYQLFGYISAYIIVFSMKYDDVRLGVNIYLVFAFALSMLWYLSILDKRFEWMLIMTFRGEEDVSRFPNGWLRIYNPALLMLGLIPQINILHKIRNIIGMLPALAPFAIVSAILINHNKKFTIIVVAILCVILYRYPVLLEAFVAQKELSYQLRQDRFPEICWIIGCDTLEYANENFYIALTQYYGILMAGLYAALMNIFLYKLSKSYIFLMLSNIVLLANPIQTFLIAALAIYWRAININKVTER